MVERINDEIIFEKLNSIFKYKSKINENQEIINRGFVCSKLKKGKVLFIGINPSFTSKAKIESYQYPIENALNDYPSHYKKFTELISNTNFENNWSYIDIFQYRETTQNKIFDFLKNDPQFIVSQLQLTHKIIQYIDPELLVICNSRASDFFGINKFETKNKFVNVWLGYNFDFEEDTGFYIAKSFHKESIIENKENNLIGKKFLFTSSLTYKSKFDKERLNWMIKRI